MNPRSRYPPPGMGNGRGGGASTNPNFYARSPHQHQQYAQQSPAHGQPSQQFQQQQQWSRRNQLGGDFGAGQIMKSVQSEATNTRFYFSPPKIDNFSCSVVILVPTRELALQTSQVCKELGKHLNIQIMVTTGGTSLKDDIMRLYQPVHLLVGTPGRILDLARKGVCVLKDCSMLILDEVIF
ncbi:hypothetical protein GW17_00033470 [Ensete ventricosum]|nr:hypothetical protein GW17_00033470 [Ensete ventricosum]RZR93716.1 hypothetical protein BHM03_00022282 [Ensete ventricosum]